jgi:hypothetical protein
MMMQGLANPKNGMIVYSGHQKYSKTPLIRINCDGEPSGYAENTGNWSFL